MKLFTLLSGQRILQAETGKTIAQKASLPEVMGPEIWLGIHAAIEDFVEVDEPQELDTDNL